MSDLCPDCGMGRTSCCEEAERQAQRATKAEADLAAAQAELREGCAACREVLGTETTGSLVGMIRTIRADLAAVKEQLGLWQMAVMAKTPPTWTFDPTNPNLSVANVARGAIEGLKSQRCGTCADWDMGMCSFWGRCLSDHSACASLPSAECSMSWPADHGCPHWKAKEA